MSNREPQPPMSVEEVLEMVPNEKSWVNDGLRAYVVDIEAGTGKPPKNQRFWKCELGSESGSSARIAMTLFRCPRFKIGDLIEINGQGIKRKEYNGKNEIGTGDKTEFHIITASQSGQPRRPAAPTQARQPQNDDRGGGHAPEDQPAPETPADGLHPVPGQTVGMVMKLAADLVMDAYKHEQNSIGLTFADLKTPELYREIHAVSSHLAKISAKLLRGDLAPFPGAPGKDQAAPARKPAPATAPAPEPERHAPPTERHTPPRNDPPPPTRRSSAPQVPDEDVPF